MTEITQADRDAAFDTGLRLNKSEWETLYLAFARHRKYGYDQGYYDGRQFDRMEERAAIVAWLRGFATNKTDELANILEAGEGI